jgi:hypothetical protein
MLGPSSVSLGYALGPLSHPGVESLGRSQILPLPFFGRTGSNGIGPVAVHAELILAETLGTDDSIGLYPNGCTKLDRVPALLTFGINRPWASDSSRKAIAEFLLWWSSCALPPCPYRLLPCGCQGLFSGVKYIVPKQRLVNHCELAVRLHEFRSLFSDSDEGLHHRLHLGLLAERRRDPSQNICSDRSSLPSHRSAADLH